MIEGKKPAKFLARAFDHFHLLPANRITRRFPEGRPKLHYVDHIHFATNKTKLKFDKIAFEFKAQHLQTGTYLVKSGPTKVFHRAAIRENLVQSTG